MNLWWIPLYLRLLKSPVHSVSSQPFGRNSENLRTAQISAPSWFRSMVSPINWWFCWDPQTYWPTDPQGDTGWKTDGFSSLKVASQKAPPEKKCQNTQNMAFYDMCDIKSIYICNMCTFIYIYHIIYFICCRHPLFYKYHIFRTCYILDVRTYIYIYTHWICILFYV